MLSARKWHGTRLILLYTVLATLFAVLLLVLGFPQAFYRASELQAIDPGAMLEFNGCSFRSTTSERTRCPILAVRSHPMGRLQSHPEGSTRFPVQRRISHLSFANSRSLDRHPPQGASSRVECDQCIRALGPRQPFPWRDRPRRFPVPSSPLRGSQGSRCLDRSATRYVIPRHSFTRCVLMHVSRSLYQCGDYRWWDSSLGDVAGQRNNSNECDRFQ